MGFILKYKNHFIYTQKHKYLSRLFASVRHLLKLKSVHNPVISKNTKAFYKHANYLLGRNKRHNILNKDINSSENISDKLAVINFANISLLFLSQIIETQIVL